MIHKEKKQTYQTNKTQEYTRGFSAKCKDNFSYYDRKIS